MQGLRSSGQPSEIIPFTKYMYIHFRIKNYWTLPALTFKYKYPSLFWCHFIKILYSFFYSLNVSFKTENEILPREKSIISRIPTLYIKKCQLNPIKSLYIEWMKIFICSSKIHLVLIIFEHILWKKFRKEFNSSISESFRNLFPNHSETI